jgi:hypothetical protein
MPSRRGHAWVAVLSEAEGLRWVLKNSRMAFSAGSATKAAKVQPGDGIVLYVARSTFHNPTRDESQLGGVGIVSSAVRPLRNHVELAGREFVCACDLDLEVVLPERAGVPVRPLINRLGFVRRKEVWGQYFRSGLIEVPRRDFALMAKALLRAGGTDR